MGRGGRSGEWRKEWGVEEVWGGGEEGVGSGGSEWGGEEGVGSGGSEWGGEEGVGSGGRSGEWRK